MRTTRTRTSGMVMAALVILSATGPGWGAPLTAADPALLASGERARNHASALSVMHIPLFFERNQGQSAPQVKYLCRTPGGTVFVTGTDAVVTIQRLPTPPSCAPFSRAAGALRSSTGIITSSVRLHLVGANAEPRVTGEDEQAGKSSYFIGSDRTKWRTSIPNYRRVRYEGIYPGVDLVYYGTRQCLEHDFIVQPGASVSSIRLKIEGAERQPQIDSAGDLIIGTAAGSLRLSRPMVYQTVGRRKVGIDGRFVRQRGGDITFAVEAYDHSRRLVIDPVVYSTFLGGSGGTRGGDSIQAIDVGGDGDAFVAGQTYSADFPTTSGAFQSATSAAARGVAFVTRLSASGTGLVYSSYLGGSGASGLRDTAYAIRVDSGGNAYVAGAAGSADFPTTSGAFQTVNKAAAGGHFTAFVARLNPLGTALLYSTFVGGSGDAYGGDAALALAIDGDGDAYITGDSDSPDFPTTSGAFQPTKNGNPNVSYTDAFVTRLNPAGTALRYSTLLGGTGAADVGQGIAVDSIRGMAPGSIAGSLAQSSSLICLPRNGESPWRRRYLGRIGVRKEADSDGPGFIGIRTPASGIDASRRQEHESP